MTTARPTRAAQTTIAVLATLGGVATATAIGALWPADDTTVDRASYSAGWQYVVNRQPDKPGAASPWLRSDTGIQTACSRYADESAQLDGITDTDAFLAGCADAAAMTRLEPTP